MAKIIVDRDKCNQDGICVEECPALVLRINPEDGYPEATEDFGEICLRCGHCVAVCPSAAFSLDWLTPEACLPIRPEWALSKGQAEQFLRSRRSIRVFKRERVPRDQIEKLIEIGCTAPSAKNMQPWQWIVIQDPKEVDRLDAMIIDWMRFLIKADPQAAEIMKLPRAVRLWDKGLYKALRNAPHMLIVHVDSSWAFGAEDTALALSYVELLAPSLGLGATWSGYFYKAYNLYPPLREAVPVPQGRKVVGAMMVGRPTFPYYRIPQRMPAKIEWR